jgi:FkbM family methyltransferase
MYIPFSDINKLLLSLNIIIKGILHIGAHDCEELDMYKNENIKLENIVWIDAIKEKVISAKKRNIPNVYNAVISDKEADILFKITNNGQSSSILALDRHLYYHAGIDVIEERPVKTITLQKFFEDNFLDKTHYNFWNIDIQGAELYALKGAGDIINNVDALYLEVNTEHLYNDCPLFDEIDTFLNDKGFNRVATYMTYCHWGDALYIRSKFYN